MSLFDELQQLEKKAREEISSVSTEEEFESLRLHYLSRKGELAQLTSKLKTVGPDEKPKCGKEANRVKNELTKLFESATVGGGTAKESSKSDLTMSSTAFQRGGLHPIRQIIDEICDIFTELGFTVESGPEMEDVRHNFGALNIPESHPSRDDDTFELENNLLLRSQTSTVQIRVMDEKKPPLKIIAPGRVYRPDATDATHSFMFHQIEGLYVDEKVSFADLKGTLMAFAKRLFGADVELRFRPHHFPFTEPSAEVDLSCGLWSETTGSKKKWLEVLGAGMVHPNVLESVGIDSSKYNGFAFGLGVERIAMLRWGIKDIRHFYSNDIRFLRQFA